MMGTNARGLRPAGGFHLLELLLAVVLVGGPLVVMVTAVVQTSRNASRLQARAEAEQVLVEWSERIARLDRSTADQLAAEGLSGWLAAIVQSHAELLTPAAQQSQRRLVQPLINTAQLVVRGGTPGQSGLAAITLYASCADGQALTVARLVWFRFAGSPAAGFAE